MREPIRVVVADDHPLVRRALRLNLEADGIDVVAEACNGREALELVGALHPDVVLLDLKMPVMDGLDAARLLAEGRSDVKIILLTSDDDEATISEAARIGARGYVLKDDPPNRLISEVRQVAEGGIGPRVDPTAQ
jgi:DNA-binding NarL/FixJ family response regulator